MEFWRQILLAEEQGRAQARASVETPRGSPTASPARPDPLPRRTYLVDTLNFTLRAASHDLFYLRDAAGIVEDVVVQSASKDYLFHLTLDDGQVDLRRTWDELYAMAQDVKGIGATKRGGVYTVILSGFAFRKNGRLILSAPKQTVFDRIYVRVTHDGR